MTFTETAETPQIQSFEIAVRLLSPVCLAAAVPTGNLTCTLDYIPGSTVRGALAALYLESGKPADTTFEQLFLSGEVTYGNLYLSGAGPAPLSARSCKHEPGFLRDETGHGVVDWLLPAFLQHWKERTHQPVTAPQHEACAHTHHGGRCNAPLEAFPRFYAPVASERKSIPTNKLRRLLTRSAIDDRLQTAEHGLLYSLEVLDPTALGSAEFRGTVVCASPAAAASAQRQLLDPIFERQSTRLSIGTARSRGLGEVETVGCRVSLTPFAPLGERLSAFNLRLRNWGVNDGRFYFSLTLHADTIIQDEYFRFHSTVPVSVLAWEADIESATAMRLKLEGCFTATRTVSGWNAALRLPKNDVTAIKMGAAFFYSIEGLTDHESHVVVDKLTRLETYGLGARRTEGFGRVVVCDPFHLDAGKEPV